VGEPFVGLHDSPGVTRSADEWLAIRCQLGEPDAFDDLVERWHGPLCAYARRVTASDDGANDAVQDVWLRIVRGIGRLRDPARLRPWIFGIARRVLMDRLRDKYAAPLLVDIVDEHPAPEPDLERDADLVALATALDRLPLIEREVLALFYLEELTLEELSDVLAIPIGTEKSRLFRARKLLRERLLTPEAPHD